MQNEKKLPVIYPNSLNPRIVVYLVVECYRTFWSFHMLSPQKTNPTKRKNQTFALAVAATANTCSLRKSDVFLNPNHPTHWNWPWGPRRKCCVTLTLPSSNKSMLHNLDKPRFVTRHQGLASRWRSRNTPIKDHLFSNNKNSSFDLADFLVNIIVYYGLLIIL